PPAHAVRQLPALPGKLLPQALQAGRHAGTVRVQGRRQSVQGPQERAHRTPGGAEEAPDPARQAQQVTPRPALQRGFAVASSPRRRGSSRVSEAPPETVSAPLGCQPPKCPALQRGFAVASSPRRRGSALDLVGTASAASFWYRDPGKHDIRKLAAMAAPTGCTCLRQKPGAALILSVSARNPGTMITHPVSDAPEGVTLGILAGGRATRLGGRDKAWMER